MSRSEVQGFFVIDPGETSGWLGYSTSELDAWELDVISSFSPHEKLARGIESGFVETGEVDCRGITGGRMDGVLRLVDLIYDFLPLSGGVLVIEDFILRTADKRKETLAPLWVTAGVLACLHSHGFDSMSLRFQQPSQAKTVVTDKRLRAWGLWVVGSAHERDAVRHAVIHLRTR